VKPSHAGAGSWDTRGSVNVGRVMVSPGGCGKRMLYDTRSASAPTVPQRDEQAALMTSVRPPCRSVLVFLFQGDRDRRFRRAFAAALDDQKNQRGPGPSAIDSLMILGHAGLSLDEGKTIFGFNPDVQTDPAWKAFERLRNDAAYPGVVRDDSAVFSAARGRSLTVNSIEVVLPEPGFLDFRARVDAERKSSQYSYGLPDGDGDCNCVTWMERLGLPLLTGDLDEFTNLRGIASDPTRRFGACL
jgi:hypothetical protein